MFTGLELRDRDDGMSERWHLRIEWHAAIFVCCSFRPKKRNTGSCIHFDALIISTLHCSCLKYLYNNIDYTLYAAPASHLALVAPHHFLACC